MPPDLGFVVHAAEAQPDEFAAGRLGDALPERGLANAGWANEAQDGAAAVRIELAHREIFEDAAFDLGQTVVVLVQDAARFRDVDRIGIELRPRQADQPIQVAADHAVFGGGIRHTLETLELLLGMVLGLLRHPGLLDRFAQLEDLGRLLVALPQLLLNVAQLLAQNMFALLGGQRLLGLIADLLRDLEHFDALHEQREHLVQPLLDVDRLEHVLLFRRFGVEDAGNEIGERGRRIQLLDRGRHLRRNIRQQLDDVLGAPLHQAHARLDVGRHDLGDADFLDARDQERKSGEILDDAEPAHALGDHMVRAVGSSDIAEHLRGSAHGMQLLGSRLLDRRIFCKTTPSMRSVRTASWAAATDDLRPIANGSTIPGNSTVCRTGSTIIASAGIGDALALPDRW